MRQEQGIRNPILAAVSAILDGTGDATALVEATARGRNEVVAMHDELHALLTGLGSHVHASVLPQFHEAQEAMRQYELGFCELEAYCLTGNEPCLTRGAEVVRRSEARLEAALAALRSAALATMGPTVMPEYNLLHALWEANHEGTPEQERALAEAIESVILRTCLDLDQVQELPRSKERERALFALRELVAACGSLLGLVQEHRAHDGAALERVACAMALLRELGPRLQVCRLSARPTRSPIVNFVAHLMAELAAGRVTDEVVLDALADLWRVLDEAAQPFLERVRASSTPPGVRLAAKRVLGALARQEEAVGNLLDFLESRNLALLHDARQNLITATDDVEHLYNDFLDAVHASKARPGSLRLAG